MQDKLISSEQLLKVVTGDSFKSDFPRMSKALVEIIKALPSVRPQEPCDDVVSREAVNDVIIWHETDGYISARKALDRIAQLPSVRPQEPKTEWIPVSERLPEDIRPVMVTWKNNNPESYYQHIIGKHFTGVAHYLKGKWFWYSSTTEDFLAEYGRYDGEEFDEAIDVIAWMPLPEPYEPQESEKIDCKSTKCENCINHNYCDYEPQESDERSDKE